MRPPDVPPPVASSGATTSADYYDHAWGEFVVGQGVDESEEPWVRQLPQMRIYGFVVLAVALVAAYPRDDPGGWRGPAALAGIAALTVAFWIMWVRRPIWAYPTRMLAAHGIFQLAAYAAMVGISPSFAVLQVLVFPQVVFSLPIRWSIAGGAFIGAITSVAILAASNGGLETALPWVFYEILAAAFVIAFAMWMRQEIAQSMERRALIRQLQAARRELATAEREAAVGEERARFAREIHDTLARGFASVVTHLEAADASLVADPTRARRDLRAARRSHERAWPTRGPWSGRCARRRSRRPGSRPRSSASLPPRTALTVRWSR